MPGPCEGAAARTHGVEAHGRDACSLGDLHRLAIEREQPNRVRRYVDEPRQVTLAVAKHLPEGVARDLEVLARAAPQIDEAVVEAGEVEEGIEPCPLDARGLAYVPTSLTMGCDLRDAGATDAPPVVTDTGTGDKMPADSAVAPGSTALD